MMSREREVLYGVLIVSCTLPSRITDPQFATNLKIDATRGTARAEPDPRLAQGADQIATKGRRLTDHFQRCLHYCPVIDSNVDD